MPDGVRRRLGAGGHRPDLQPVALAHPWPVAVQVSLTGLLGLTYPIRALRRGQEVTAVSYADWGRFVLEPDGEPDALSEPEGASLLDFVLASAANPGGFAPRLLDRTGSSTTTSVERRSGTRGWRGRARSSTRETEANPRPTTPRSGASWSARMPRSRVWRGRNRSPST